MEKAISIPKQEAIDFYFAGKKEYQRAETVIKAFSQVAPQAYKKIMHSGVNPESATGSGLLLNMALEIAFPNLKNLSLEDIVRIQKTSSEFFKKIYSDTTEILLYSPIPSIEENTQIIKSLTGIVGPKEYGCNSPLIITGLTIIPDSNSQNPYGVAFKKTSKTKIQNDPRFAHSNNQKKVDFNGTEIKVRTKKNGFSRLFVYDDGLNALDGDIAYSDDGGREIVVNAEGVDFQK